MIDQDLINKCESDIEDFGSLMKCQAQELLKNYISLIEQNAELHKELAKLKGDRVFAVNEDIAIAASDSSCQDWSRLEYKEIHRSAFIEGAKYAIESRVAND